MAFFPFLAHFAEQGMEEVAHLGPLLEQLERSADSGECPRRETEETPDPTGSASERWAFSRSCW